MATINLGAIKFNWKGAYNSSTTYAVDDVVSSGGSSYVCIQAHSNQAVGNATAYWNIMSSAGTNGTNGSAGDTFGLANNEIAFKTNAGALDGIAIGTAGQSLKVNSGATGYEFGLISSDYVKLASVDTSTVTEVNFDNYFTTDYYQYMFVGSVLVSTNSDRIDFNPRIGGSNILAGNHTAVNYGYRQWSGGSNTNMSMDSGVNNTQGAKLGWGHTDTALNFQVLCSDPLSTGKYKMHMWDCASIDTSYLYRRNGADTWKSNTGALSGMRFFNNNGRNCHWKITMLGIRK